MNYLYFLLFLTCASYHFSLLLCGQVQPNENRLYNKLWSLNLYSCQLCAFLSLIVINKILCRVLVARHLPHRAKATPCEVYIGRGEEVLQGLLRTSPVSFHVTFYLCHKQCQKNSSHSIIPNSLPFPYKQNHLYY